MSAPDSASSIWDFFQIGEPYWLGEDPIQLWSPVLGSLGLNEHLRILHPHERPMNGKCPCLKPLSKVKKKNWTWFPISEIRKRVGQVLELRDKIFMLSAWRNLRSLTSYWAHREDWSDWPDTQADLIFAGRTGDFVGFIVLRLIWRFRCGALTHVMACL